jgi:putative ABC transport system permease protein
VELSGAAWGSDPDGVYVSHAGALLTGGALQQGTTITFTAANGQRHAVRVVGFYRQPFDMSPVELTHGIIASQELTQRLTGTANSHIVTVAVSTSRQAELKTALVRTVPAATALSTVDLNARSQQFAGNMFWLAVSVAGLALAAGALLIANAVGLAMLERRREIGIFKAIGFSSGHVLKTILIEHGLLGLVGGAVGTAAVAAVVMYYNSVWPAAPIAFQPLLALMLVGIAIAITIGSATLVAWRPTQIRPLGVLRDE